MSSSALHCYVQQTSRGEIVIGGGSDPYPLYNSRASLPLKESLISSAVEMFPFLSEMRLLRQWAGITDMTSDYSPIMGLSPVENYYIDAAGDLGFQGDADLRQNNGRAGSDGWQGARAHSAL